MKEFWLAVLVTVIDVFIEGAIVVWLWNSIMVALFALPMITFGQAISLMVLASCFFGKINFNSKG